MAAVGRLDRACWTCSPMVSCDTLLTTPPRAILQELFVCCSRIALSLLPALPQDCNPRNRHPNLSSHLTSQGCTQPAPA